MICKRAISFFLFFVLHAIATRAQLSASFTASPLSGCAPQVISFNNNSVGATSYTWDFGNNSPLSHNISPATSYTNPGTFTVRLAAYNGNDSSIATLTVTIYPPPTVSFTANDTLVCPGASVSFTNTSSSNTPGPATYSWNFGDGDTSNLQNPSHIFPGPGYYSITLIVTNAQGCTSTYVRNAYVHVANPPVAAFSVNDTSFCKVPAQAIFTNSSSGTPVLSSQWNFGDGSALSPITAPTHNYLATNNYTVTLVITDGNGCKDTLVKPNYIKVDNLTGTISCPDTACPFQTVSFSVNTTATVGCSWDFGDGGTAYSNTTAHSYGGQGTYQVTLIINDGTCLDTITKPVYIRPQPAASFTFSPQHPCPLPVSIQFNPTAPAGYTYTWSFGDGSTSQLANPTHNYTTAQFANDTGGGYDSVILTVTDVHGCTNSVMDTLKIYDLHGFVYAGTTYPLSAIPISGCPPVTVHFKDLIGTSIPMPPPLPPGYWPYPYPITSYSWNFGDGSPVTNLDSPTHTFSNAGYYNTVVTITTANGCTLKDSMDIALGVAPVITSFTANPTTICLDDSVVFIAHSTGNFPTAYMYFPGDSANGLPISNVSDTLSVHRYPQPGVYYAFVMASNYGCFSDTSIKIPITVNAPLSVFSDSVKCTPRTLVKFQETSISATSFLWLFGDGDTSTLQNPVHNYPALGYYTAKLATYNSTTGCRDTASRGIHLFDLAPLWDDTAICKNTTLNIQPSFSNGPGVITQYFWYIDNILKSFHCNGCPFTFPPWFTNFTYTFDSVHLAAVKLVLVDSNLCRDTMQNTVLVAKPVDHFTASPVLGCLPLTVTFTDTSWFLAGTNFVSAYWDFGDNNHTTVSTTSTSHYYTTSGIFDIEEIVTDNIGCSDTLTKYAYVNVDKASAHFNVPNVFPCIGDSVHFNNYSFNNIIASHWSFGDGDTSTIHSPVHLYSDTGSYTVTLIVTDTFGCKDTLIMPAYIKVTKPHAAFTMNDSTGICIPLNIQFTNTSVGASTYAWHFGNGSSSFAFSPTNPYTVPGQDTIMLIATNTHGCSDTVYHHAVLYGYAGSLTYSPLIGCRPLTVNFIANVLNLPFLRFDFNDGTVSPISAVNTISHTYTTPGAYVPRLIMSDTSGCIASSIGLDTIKVDSVAARFNYTPLSICIFDTIGFTDSSRSMFSTVTSWQWNFSDGGSSNQQNPQHIFGSAGSASITVIVTDGIGCKDTLTKTVTVYPLPILTATGDTTVCVGDAAPITVSANVALSTWSWSPSASLSCSNCQSPNALPDTETVYIVKGTNAQGCSDTSSVIIKTKTHILTKAGPGGEICVGGSVALSDSGAQSYIWSPTAGLDNNQIADPVASPGTTTTYTVIARIGSCIPDTAKVKVIIDPLPQVSAGPDQTITAGNTATLQATGSNTVKYVWSPAEMLSCDTCVNPVVHIDQTTVFTVIAYSMQGCIDSSKVTVHLICDQKQVFIPNSFTPNGDGQNDVFYPRGIGLRIIKSFRIYDRWGELIFERDNINLNDETSGWDGTYKSGKPRPDVYVYAIDAICETGEELSWKGDVTIIR